MSFDFGSFWIRHFVGTIVIFFLSQAGIKQVYAASYQPDLKNM